MEFEVEGMTCGHCVRAITRAIHTLDPDARVDVDLAQGMVTVEGQALPDFKMQRDTILAEARQIAHREIEAGFNPESTALARHMAEAEQHMLDLQAKLMDRFLTEEATPARTRKRRTA